MMKPDRVVALLIVILFLSIIGSTIFWILGVKP